MLLSSSRCHYTLSLSLSLSHTHTHTHITHSHSRTHTHTHMDGKSAYAPKEPHLSLERSLHNEQEVGGAQQQANIYIFIYLYTLQSSTIDTAKAPKLQIIFHKRATKYRALLRKMTYKDKGSYESSPPCNRRSATASQYLYIYIFTYLYTL